MSKFFKALAFLVAVCCLTWLGVLWRWQRTGHDSDVQDVVLYLVLLPLALMLLLLALRWIWRRAALRSAASAVPAASAGAASAPGADASNAAEAEARHAVMQLVQVATCTRLGDQISDLVDAAESGKPLPQPDSELSNDDGLPVMCARIPDKSLPLEALNAELDAVLAHVRPRQPDWSALEPRGDVLRALSALQQPLQAHKQWLMGMDQAHKAALEDAGQAPSKLPSSQRPPLPGLRVLLGWPAHWNAFEQALARAWVEKVLAAQEGDLSESYALSYTALAGTGEDLWLRVDQMCQPAHRVPWLLVAACHSDVAPERVDALAVAQRLYSASDRPGGCIPGEAAAALLLAPPEWAPPADMEIKPVMLHRPALMRRDKPVEATGRTGHRELAEAVSQALMAAQIDAQALGMLVCDGDQHSARTQELYGMAVDALPHLDPVEDMRLLGKITGYTGVSSWLLVLAAAATAAQSSKKKTLALGLADSQLRMALVLKPLEEPDATA